MPGRPFKENAGSGTNTIFKDQPHTDCTVLRASSSNSLKCCEPRCECGRLLARLTSDGVELKCKRCKRIVVIPYASLAEAPA